tara:strand:- start:690 stop:890 length:201 start_codon:yes stop_codon:yes gene_type:complete
MDITNTLWLDAYINKLKDSKASDRRDHSQGYWDGYCSEISPMLGTEESVRDDIRRRERMAEACYDV